MKAKFGDKLRYAFDNLMSKGLIALIGLLALVSFAFIAVVSVVVVLFGLFPPDNDLDFFEALWNSLLRTLDPGTMGQDAGVGYRGAMLVVTISGLIVVASLIGIVSNAFNDKVEQLRKGRSKVLERNHTLVLGWNSKIFQVIQELVIANESHKRSVIVILADQDKVEMEEALKTKLRDLKTTRLVIRSGDPMSVRDLELTGVDEARSIIILSPDDTDEGDNFSIKTALAILNNADRRPEPYQIVGEIRHEHNLEVASLVGGNEVQWILGEELISRLIVQTSRQSGLSSVFTDLLDFEGSEIYLSDALSLSGKTYGDAALSFETAAVLGLIRDGNVLLNPVRETLIAATDKIICLAEDETKLSISEKATFDAEAIKKHKHEALKPERTLILGSNLTLHMVLSEIDSCAARGSDVFIVDNGIHLSERPFANITVHTVDAEPSSRQVLEKLDVVGFQHIIVLADRETRTVEQADARTLLTLLNLRAMAKSKPTDVNIVSEMLNDHNRELAESTHADDFIVSDKLVSNMITMVAENQDLQHVLQAFFTSEGAQVRLHPADWYFNLGTPVDFNTITESALHRTESALGYRRLVNGKPEVTINPSRTDKVTFSEGDKIIVLSED